MSCVGSAQLLVTQVVNNWTNQQGTHLMLQMTESNMCGLCNYITHAFTGIKQLFYPVQADIINATSHTSYRIDRGHMQKRKKKKSCDQCKDVSSLVDTSATHFFVSPKLAKESSLPTRNVIKLINMRFAKGKPHETKEAVLHVTLNCGPLEFIKSFTLCEIDEVDIIGGHLQNSHGRCEAQAGVPWSMTKRCI